ncbi:MAG: hypothetical protein JO320_27840 [Alphaproteobacteria bacterium]|nr:hypothetical protein [Alphaproteobacteria bacterium]MBV9378819.1 hypothetical protein [Alphaproteobacteria bacterium]MBV9816552.1 hypothetical protein [Alphaproteobacteria bacterium]
MKTVAKCAAFAGVLMLTAGSAAWAQNSTTMSGTPGSGTQGTNQGYYTGGTQGYQGTYNPSQGTYGANQGSWNTGTQGSSTPNTGQTYSHSGYGMGNINTYQEAEQQLGRYGYSNIQDLKATQGWSADAMKNGQRVHVLLGDNGLVATFPGR